MKTKAKKQNGEETKTIYDAIDGYTKGKMPWDMRIDTKIAAAVSAVSVLILVGTLSYHFLESWSWVQSFYFSVITLTTVGYGDIYPTTDISRLFTAVYILSGVAIVLTSLEIIGTTYITRREGQILMRRQKQENEMAKLKKKR